MPVACQLPDVSHHNITGFLLGFPINTSSNDASSLIQYPHVEQSTSTSYNGILDTSDSTPIVEEVDFFWAKVEVDETQILPECQQNYDRKSIITINPTK